MIGDNVEITILDISKEQIKIGIDAPRSVPIHRKEVYIQIQEENRTASKSEKSQLDQLKKLL